MCGARENLYTQKSGKDVEEQLHFRLKDTLAGRATDPFDLRRGAGMSGAVME